MKKIMMTKYGFVRWPEEDFSDDGSRFLAYRAGERVRVTKYTYNGEAFISARIDGAKLPYEAYSMLPHYSAIRKLNGVAIAALTDQDLIDLYEACLAYEREYTEAENNIVMPTYDEIHEQCRKIQAKRYAEMEEVEALLASKVAKLVLNMSEWQWQEVRQYFKRLADEAKKYNTYVDQIFNKSQSISFCKPDCTDLKDHWYYTQLIDMLNKY